MLKFVLLAELTFCSFIVYTHWQAQLYTKEFRLGGGELVVSFLALLPSFIGAKYSKRETIMMLHKLNFLP